MANNNGLNIQVSRDKFTSMDQEERDWVLYQAIREISIHGCNWAQGRWRRLYVIGGATGFIGGFIAVLAKWVFT